MDRRNDRYFNPTRDHRLDPSGDHFRERGSGQMRPDFAGRGPKGYRRSDERIREDVCEALLHSSLVDASDIEVEVENRVVKLKGTIATRWMKRMMEDLIDRVSGVEDVLNETRVRSDAVRPPLSELMGFEERETGWEAPPGFDIPSGPPKQIEDPSPPTIDPRRPNH